MYVPSLYLGTLYVFVYTLQRFIRRLCGWAWFLTPKHLEGSFTYILLLGCAICIYIARLRRSGAHEISSMTSPAFLLKSTYISITKYKQNAIIYPHILTLLLRKFFCPTILNLLPVGIRQFAVSFFSPNIFYICRIEKKVGPTEI